MIRIDIKRTDFFNELSSEEQKDYFSQKAQKYIPNIDNIYYSVSLKGDTSENSGLKRLFKELSSLKENVQKTHESMHFQGDLYMESRGFKIYKYCLSRTDLYDVFILDYLPNPETPRILVQIRSYGLWIHGYEEMLNNSFKNVKDLFLIYGCEVDKCVENRIDYCFHTNAIKEPEKVFSDLVIKNAMKTTLERYHITGRIGKNINTSKTELLKDYFALGERKSNFVFIRFYNKALEVVEKGYKAYFFNIWYENGLINFYDKFCFEYAYKEKNYDYVHKAKLEFYLIYGTNDMVKKEFKTALENKNLSASDYNIMASSYMPEVTKVLNCEFETKRKFYYLSHDFINDVLKCVERNNSYKPLERIYKIIDNRIIFLDYITSKTISFSKNDGEYSDWWERLRKVKLDCIKTDLTLIRDYSNMLDLEVMKRRFINNIASNAVYLDKTSDSGFLEDITDILSNINDNDKYNVTLSYYDDECGEVSKDFHSELLNNYKIKKAVKEKQILNRKKNKDKTS